MAMSDAAVRATLQEHGIAVTKPRLVIGGLVLSCPQHLTAERVWERLLDAGARVSKATVYNTLNLFAQKGVLRQLNVDPAVTWFDSNTQPHFHFQHVDSGELVDVQCDGLTLTSLLDLPPGTESVGIDLVIRIRQKAV